jgi:hypothetical protein
MHGTAEGNQIDRHRYPDERQEHSDDDGEPGGMRIMLAALDLTDQASVSSCGIEIDHHSDCDERGAEPE